jgi:thiol-disulfide isomerase/thioredoxin
LSDLLQKRYDIQKGCEGAPVNLLGIFMGKVSSLMLSRFSSCAFILMVGVALWYLPNSASAVELKLWKGGATPPLALSDLNGSHHQLSDYRGNVVLINFWATWCAPCRDEMPSIQRLKEKLAGRPFTVLAVNLDEPETRIRKFLSGMKIDFIVLLDPHRKVAKAWDARFLPVSFIIGPDGKVRYTLVGEVNWDHGHIVSIVSELLPN